MWTVATKYTLLCMSVPILVRLDVLNGGNWETRREMGLVEGVHYLGLSGNFSTTCNEIENHMNWIVNNPNDAYKIAMKSRELALARLNRKVVLSDFAKIIVDYAKVYNYYKEESK